MSYEVNTPMLIEAADAARAVISGLGNGSVEIAHAREINNAAGRLVSVVATDVKTRLAAPKIAAYEAKMIDGGSQKQIAAE